MVETMDEARSDSRRVPEVTRLVGGLEVSVLVDAAGPFLESREVAFPEATAPDWAAVPKDGDADHRT